MRIPIKDRTKSLEEMIPFDRKRVLDLGCGTGYRSDRISKLYPWMGVTGIDSRSEFIAKAQAKYSTDRVLFQVGDVADLPFPDESFDCVYANNTLEHPPNLEQTLREIFRVLCWRGVLVAAIPSNACPPQEVSDNPTWQTVAHEAQMRFEKVGFVNIQIQGSDKPPTLAATPHTPSDARMSYVRAWKRHQEVGELERALEAMDWVYRNVSPERSSHSSDPIQILSEGYAFCWGYVVVLGKLLEREGFSGKWVTMLAKDVPGGRGKEKVDSHEVLIMEIDGKEIILDPMAHTFIPYSLSEVLRHPDLAKDKDNPDARYITRRYSMYDTEFWYSRVFKYAVRLHVKRPIVFWKKNAGKHFSTLRNMSSSPYDPELPKRSLIVNLFMKLAKSQNRANNYTPHLFGGTNLSKVEWEYTEAPTFLECIKDYVSIDVFHHKDVLDVGSGWGGKMIYFAENSKLKTISGFDLPGGYLPEVSVELALRKKITNCFFKTGYAEDIPYDNDKFDLIIMEDVLEHVADPERVMNECYRVLRPMGTIILKFPSFKMMNAHHLDRALNLPALHYILPLKTWAAGLNYLLLNPAHGFSYDPFSEIVSTKYCKSITKNLNGLDFAPFREIIRKTNFRKLVMELVPYRTDKANRSIVKSLYGLVYKTGILTEFLSHFILFVGEKNGNN